MHTITLTEEELTMAQTALQYTYDRKLDIVRSNHKILSQEERERIVSNANKYFDLSDKFNKNNFKK